MCRNYHTGCRQCVRDGEKAAKGSVNKEMNGENEIKFKEVKKVKMSRLTRGSIRIENVNIR